MSISNRQELVDYCLRKLGAPVINIEVDASQIEDCIEDALHHYTEFHFDGIVRDYLVHKISGTVLNVADSTGFIVGDVIQSMNGLTSAKIANVSPSQIIINRQIGYDKFQANQTVKNANSSNTVNINSVVLGDVDNEYIPAGDDVVGVTKILNVTSVLGSSDYMFNMQYQIMMTELQALTKAGASMYWQTLNYLGHIDFIMKKEKNFTFHRRMNRLYLEISWSSDVKVGDVIVAEVYRSLDPELYHEVYDDIWLKRYATALLKKQWGTNLSKYSGMQLPGGMTYNGQQIYQDALVDIEKLENEALYSSAPLSFDIG